jgi:hypothetical protein
VCSVLPYICHMVSRSSSLGTRCSLSAISDTVARSQLVAFETTYRNATMPVLRPRSFMLVCAYLLDRSHDAQWCVVPLSLNRRALQQGPAAQQ